MDTNKIREILEFWESGVDEYDDIVAIKEMAAEDISVLIYFIRTHIQSA